MTGGRLVAAAALLLSACGAAPADTPQTSVVRPVEAGPSAALAAAIAQAHPAAAVRRIDRLAAEVRRVVAAQLGPRLLDGAATLEGADFRFTPADAVERHAGVLVLRYPTAALAQARSARLVAAGATFFEGGKILTPMIADRSGATVAVFFTESGGDPAIRRLLAEAARRYI